MTPWPILADRIDVNNLIVYVVVILFGVLASLFRTADKGKRASQSGRQTTGTGGPPPVLPPQRPPAPPPRAARPPRLPSLHRLVARRLVVPGAPPQAEPASWDVTEEVRRQKQRLELGQADRDPRFTTAAQAEADTAGIEARLLHVRPKAPPTQAAVAVDLLAGLRVPDALRQAILHYEIFAPPKALRPGPELWEL